MKKFLAAVALPLSILAMLPSTAQASLDLAKKSACMACHAVDKKVVGPAYRDVAAKYKGQKDAEAALIKQIKEGGSGKWGAVPMPAQAHVKPEDMKTLAKWILDGAK